MDESQILERMSDARASAMLMISILVSIVFGYLAAFYLVLSERRIGQRLFVYFVTLGSFAFFILNFGLPLRKEITALTADLKALAQGGVSLSQASKIVIDPCAEMYFEFFRGLVTKGGQCRVDETVYAISDWSTAGLWILIFVLTVLNPWRNLAR